VPPTIFTDEMGIAAAEKAGVRLTSPDREIYAGTGITKAKLVAYYTAVAGRMLPHIANRPLSLVRRPSAEARPFYQKHDSGGFPAAFSKIPLVEGDGDTGEYMYITDLAGLIGGVQMNVLEFHMWGSHVDELEKPDRIIFDIDPDEGLDFAATRDAAITIRDRLVDLGLVSFPMLTGGKGIHVIAPLRRTLEWPEVKAFCHAFADRLATDEPGRFTSNIRKARRIGRMFVDYLRNERGSTAISPYSTRAKDGCPVAVPVSWDEVPDLAAASQFSLADAAARAATLDPWPGYFDSNQSITKGMLAKVQ
jgi:bifunctional non-homologous end joining protein LigD